MLIDLKKHDAFSIGARACAHAKIGFGHRFRIPRPVWIQKLCCYEVQTLSFVLHNRSSLVHVYGYNFIYMYFTSVLSSTNWT